MPSSREALRIAHEDLGVTHVRAHAILHDDNHVVSRAADGSLSFDFREVDAIYDQLLGMGLRPVVEVSFMPAAIARDADQTVFDYRAIVSPPADWSQWRAVVSALAEHLVERYGVDEVRRWPFEVWNEPNLEVFWTGSQEEYLRLYDEAAAAIKEVDGELRVGGPPPRPVNGSRRWPHTRSAPRPAGLRDQPHLRQPAARLPWLLRRHGFGRRRHGGRSGASARPHFKARSTTASSAPRSSSAGCRDAQGRMEALAYWVVSDHFEELGRPEALFHDGFGLLTLGNLRKPRYWALAPRGPPGRPRAPGRVSGDGADVLVRSWATRHDDGPAGADRRPGLERHPSTPS